MELDLLREPDMHITVGGLGGHSAPPAPTGWTARRFSAGFVLSLGFLALVTACLAGGAAWAFNDGQPVPGILLGAGAAYIGHLVGFGWRVLRGARPTSRAPTLTATPDGGGVKFAYSAWPYYWLTAVLLLTELGLLAVVIAIMAASGTPLGIALAVITTALAVGMGWFLVTMLRRAPGSIVLTQAGVHHNGLTFTHFVPWHSIVGVAAEWLNTPIILIRAVPAEDTRVRRHAGRLGSAAELRFLPYLVAFTYWLATNPATAYHTLAYYHTHPDQRPELATPAALNRITSGRTMMMDQ
jgi:hypothetical protein